jgi:hypothetical protein
MREWRGTHSSSSWWRRISADHLLCALTSIVPGKGTGPLMSLVSATSCSAPAVLYGAGNACGSSSKRDSTMSGARPSSSACVLARLIHAT